MATVTCNPASVREDANGLLVFLGDPDRALAWSVSGTATLTILTTSTDAQGRAYAKLNPGVGSTGETLTVSVTYGT